MKRPLVAIRLCRALLFRRITWNHANRLWSERGAVNGTKVVARRERSDSGFGNFIDGSSLKALLGWTFRLLMFAFALPAFCAAPSVHPVAAAQPLQWPTLAGAFAIALLFITWWQHARHRRRLEKANMESKQSEEEARRAFAALQESEEKFRLLFENTSDAIMFVDPQTQSFVDCNDAALQITQGGSREWLFSQPIHKISAEVQPDGGRSDDKLRKLIADALQHGPQRTEWMAKRFTGEEFMVDSLVMPVRLRNRTLLVSVVRDISQQKRAEQALRENQQLLTSILDNISEGVYRSSPERDLIFANRAYLRMFGYGSLEDLRGVPRERLYASPQDRTRLLQLIENCGGYANEEVEYRRKDGSTFWGLASSIAVHEPRTDRVVYHVGAITNITERRNAEHGIRELNQNLERRIAEQTTELRASEAQFRTLVEHAPEAIVVLDGDSGKFLSGNENTLRLFGVTREILTQLTPVEVSPPFQPNGRTSGEMAAEMMRRAGAGETPVFEWMYRNKSGRMVPSEVRLVRLPAEGRNLLRASILDTSDRCRREQIQQATYHISEAAHTTEDLDTLYERIHGIIKGLMPAENFYLALRDERSGLYHYAYHRDEVDARPGPRPMNSGLNGYVLRTGKALLAPRGSMTDPQSEWHLAAGTPSAIWLGVPLAVRGRISGVMAVQDYRNESAYGEEEKQILTFVAEQIALAIDRKRAEQALRESEEKHRALFEASSLGVMLHDEHQFLEVNPAAVRILGFNSADEIIGKHPSQTSAPIQMNGEPADVLARKHIADCIEKGSTRFEWLSRSPSGGEVPLEVILTRIHLRGQPIFQATVNDISERKKAEAALRASEERFKLLFDMSPLGMAQVRWDGSFVRVNRAFADMIGYTVDECPEADLLGGHAPRVRGRRTCSVGIAAAHREIQFPCEGIFPQGRPSLPRRAQWNEGNQRRRR